MLSTLSLPVGCQYVFFRKVSNQLHFLSFNWIVWFVFAIECVSSLKFFDI